MIPSLTCEDDVVKWTGDEATPEAVVEESITSPGGGGGGGRGGGGYVWYS